MQLRTFIVALILGLSVTTAFPKQKNRDWQIGKLIRIEQGASEAGPGVIVSGMVVPTRSNSWVYVIETATTTYDFWSASGRPRPLTINNDVKFVMEPKGRAFLLDENGHEFRASLIKVTQNPSH